MTIKSSPEIQVSLDVGSSRHAVAIGLSNGESLDEFEIAHDRAGFKDFFSQIKAAEKKYKYAIVVAMEATMSKPFIVIYAM